MTTGNDNATNKLSEAIEIMDKNIEPWSEWMKKSFLEAEKEFAQRTGLGHMDKEEVEVLKKSNKMEKALDRLRQT